MMRRNPTPLLLGFPVRQAQQQGRVAKPKSADWAESPPSAVQGKENFRVHRPVVDQHASLVRRNELLVLELVRLRALNEKLSSAQTWSRSSVLLAAATQHRVATQSVGTQTDITPAPEPPPPLRDSSPKLHDKETQTTQTQTQTRSPSTSMINSANQQMRRGVLSVMRKTLSTPSRRLYSSASGTPHPFDMHRVMRGPGTGSTNTPQSVADSDSSDSEQQRGRSLVLTHKRSSSPSYSPASPHTPFEDPDGEETDSGRLSDKTVCSASSSTKSSSTKSSSTKSSSTKSSSGSGKEDIGSLVSRQSITSSSGTPRPCRGLGTPPRRMLRKCMDPT